MRHIDHSLDNPLKTVSPYFVKEKRQNDRRGKRENDAVQCQKKGISHQRSKIGAGKKPGKMLQAYPRAHAKPSVNIVVLEPNQDSPHGEIPEYNKEHNARYAHYVKPGVLA
jgi:hypothetical protein